jgi:hypothetical protein
MSEEVDSEIENEIKMEDHEKESACLSLCVNVFDLSFILRLILCSIYAFYSFTFGQDSNVRDMEIGQSGNSDNMRR